MNKIINKFPRVGPNFKLVADLIEAVHNIQNSMEVGDLLCTMIFLTSIIGTILNRWSRLRKQKASS